MTKAEACAELARRIGYNSDATIGLAVADYVPDFFSSRDAAAELVGWIRDTSAPYESVFAHNLRRALFATKDMPSIGVCDYLLATPEQITLAACAALGITLDEGGTPAL